MNDSHYSTKYALIYTVLVTIILLVPLFFYTIYMKNIHEIQNELLLKEKSLLIIKAMQNFDSEAEEYFEYPRFRSFESGLYTENFKPIFTLIKDPIKYFKKGYYIDNGNAYLVVKLPKERYFGASYLVIKNKLSFAPVYEKVFLILLSILIFVFVLSVFFLKTFAKPFQKMNKQLDNFIKDSMHEINTPLSIINVNIDLFNRRNPQNKYLQRVKAAAKVLSNIYNDMDYLIKHEILEHEKKAINLKEFLQERIDYFNEVAKMKDIEIVATLESCSSVFMNEKQLQRLIDNNISNAIKYSYEHSKIEILLQEQNGRCVMSFKDYGVGIEKVEKIFSRYYREDNSKGGFGIGLNIVKAIINSENINLQIESTPKKGSIFRYIFPRYPQAKQEEK